MLDQFKIEEYNSLNRLVKPEDRESIHQRLSTELDQSGQLKDDLKQREIDHYNIFDGEQGYGWLFVKGVKSTVFDFYIMLWDGNEYRTYGCNANDVSEIIHSFQKNPFIQSSEMNDEHDTIKENIEI